MKLLNFLCLFFCPVLIFSQSFTNIAPSIGVNYGYGFGLYGGGISFCDYTGDGLDDLTLATKTGVRFFTNTNGMLNEIPSLINNTNEIKQILWADYDNDGDKDLFVTTFSSSNRLYKNSGNSTFSDVTLTANIPHLSSDNFGANFSDINNDGWLDLYITSYSNPAITTDPENYMLINNQDGTFTDISGISILQAGIHLTFAAVFFDYNNDLLPDLYTANDKTSPNQLYENVDGNSFLDKGMVSGAGITIDAMNTGIGDYNNDGYLDIYVTNTFSGNALLSNNADGTFTEVGAAAGVTFNDVCWGGNFLDFDNDMDLDLYVSCDNTSGNYPNVLYQNNGDGTFDVPNVPNLPADNNASHANAFGDFNDDGLLDLVVCNNFTNPFTIWENQTSTMNNWVKIALEGTQSNKDGIGAWIEIDAGGTTQFRYTTCGEAFLAQNTNNHHIGIGVNTIVDEIRIRWPSGNIDVIQAIVANQKIKIKEGAGIISPSTLCAQDLFLHTIIDGTVFQTDNTLSADCLLPLNSNLTFRAGISVDLLPDFEIPLGTVFTAEIGTCN